MQADLEEDFCCSDRQQLPFLPVCGCLDHCCHCLYLENTSGLKQKTLEEKVIFFSSLSPFLVHKIKLEHPSQAKSYHSCWGVRAEEGLQQWYLGTVSRRPAGLDLLASTGACCQSPSGQQQQVIGNVDQFVPSLSQVNLALHFSFVPISRSSQTS